mmetsp:Transcript_28321/g.76289  ORF Transcript_28321/g.76289 Transcript_28321/m.76289 type:complete len:312 (-) Transcript_28321:380-1315(-)
MTASASTRVVMPSRSGGARGSTQGSWRPLASSTVDSPSKVAVCCACPIVLTALMATRNSIGVPTVMPPRVPPALLVEVVSLPDPGSVEATNGSLCAEPRMAVPRNPVPISKPFVAGRDIMAWASLASRRSKQGSPSPGGTPVHMVVRVPPMESLAAFTLRMTVAMRQAVSGCGQRRVTTSVDSHALRSEGGLTFTPSRVYTQPPQSLYAGVTSSSAAARKAFSVSSLSAGSLRITSSPRRSTSSRVHPVPLAATTSSGIETSPTDCTQVTTRVPKFSLSHFSATAPAATRPMVSRAEDLPPPEDARVPYLS